jgi:WD40 repeat protein
LLSDFFLLGCSEREENAVQNSSNPIVHPTESAFLPDSMIGSVINTSEIIDTPIYTENELLVRIGKNKGELEEILGSLTGAGVVGDEFLVIADDQQNVIRVYDLKTGGYLFPLARRGRGPGELFEIAALETNGRIVAAADRIQKIELYKWKDGDEFENRAIDIDFTPHFLCLLGDRLFVSGFHYVNKNTIHVYDVQDGQHIKSFHDAYPSESFMTQMMLSNNRVACNNSTGTVAIINPYLPYVYGYNSEGERLWTSKLKDFAPVEATEFMSENGRPGITKSIRPDGITDIYSQFISFEDSDFFLLQMNRMEKKDGETIRGQLLTMKIDAGTGVGHVISSEHPIIEDLPRNYTISKTNRPYPQIMVYERNEP